MVWLRSRYKQRFVSKGNRNKEHFFDCERGYERKKERKKLIGNGKGFLQIIIPLLKNRSDITVNVYTKEKVEVFYDLRLKVSNLMDEIKDKHEEEV